MPSGPWWSYLDDIPADLHEPMELSAGVQISKTTQDFDGKATIEITHDAARDPHTEAFSFVAITKDGRTLNNIRGSHSPTSDGFTFNVPLDQVKNFQCRKREIKEVVFKKGGAGTAGGCRAAGDAGDRDRCGRGRDYHPRHRGL